MEHFGLNNSEMQLLLTAQMDATSTAKGRSHAAFEDINLTQLTKSPLSL